MEYRTAWSQSGWNISHGSGELMPLVSDDDMTIEEFTRQCVKTNTTACFVVDNNIAETAARVRKFIKRAQSNLKVVCINNYLFLEK